MLPSDFRITILRRLSILFASRFVRESVGEIYTEILWICAQNSLISLSRYRRYCSSWKFNLLKLFGNNNMIRFYIKWKLEKRKQRNFSFRIRANCCLVCDKLPAHIFYSHFNNIFSPFETKGIIFQCYEMCELRNMSIFLSLNPNSVLRRLRASNKYTSK